MANSPYATWSSDKVRRELRKATQRKLEFNDRGLSALAKEQDARETELSKELEARGE